MPFSLLPVQNPPARVKTLPTKRAASFVIGILLAAALFFAGLAACSMRQQAAGQANILAGRAGNFDTTANITYKDMKATATIIQETPRSCAVAFSSPPSLDGMSFVFREGFVDMAYKGLAFTFDPQSLPGGAAAKIAVSGINRAMRDEGVTVDYTDGVLSLSGIMESGEFSLRLDPENGNLLKLLVPAEELEIEFVNFTFIE